MATINVTITITTPQGVTTGEAISLFAQHHDYKSTLDDGSPNPETKAQFAKRTIARQVSEAIKVQQIINAKKTAEETELAKPQIIVD